MNPAVLAESETVLSVLTSPAHIVAELVLMLIFDVALGMLALPFARRRFSTWRERLHGEFDASHGIDHDVQVDDEVLNRRVKGALRSGGAAGALAEAARINHEHDERFVQDMLSFEAHTGLDEAFDSIVAAGLGSFTPPTRVLRA